MSPASPSSPPPPTNRSLEKGSSHWWRQRLTSIALIPLSLWFMWAIPQGVGQGYEAYRAWVSIPGNAILLVLLTIVLFHHAVQGLQVIIEDYVHQEKTKLISLVCVKCMVFLLGGTCIFSILKVSFGG